MNNNNRTNNNPSIDRYFVEVHPKGWVVMDRNTRQVVAGFAADDPDVTNALREATDAAEAFNVVESLNL